MFNRLTGAFRLRRVLLVGSGDAQTLYTKALLDALGARTACIAPDAPLPRLNRALHNGRIAAVILPSAHALCPGGLSQQLGALRRLLGEMREAGVPLLILCSHEDVYAPQEACWQAEETAPIGGRTQAGLFQSILQLYADGFSRGLLGSPVRTLIVRHAPCLGGGHESTAQYSAWCRALLCGDSPVIEHPQAQGTFLHPLDAALGTLCLCAGAMAEEPGFSGCFNIAPAPGNLCANRSAFSFLALESGSKRAAVHAYPPRKAAITPLCGRKLARLCAFSPVLNAKDALSFLFEHERALVVGEEAARLLRREQAQRALKRLT